MSAVVESSVCFYHWFLSFSPDPQPYPQRLADIEAIKSRIAWCMDLLLPPIISTSSEILSRSLVNASTSFSGTLLLCNSGGDVRDRSPFCLSGGEWSNLDCLRKGFRKGLSCWVSFPPSVLAGEIARIEFCKIFVMSIILGPNL